MRAPSTLPHRLAVLSAGFFVTLGVFFWLNLDTTQAQAALLPSIGTDQLGRDTLEASSETKKATIEATITAPAQLSTVQGGSVSVRSELGVPDLLKQDIDVEKPTNPAPRQALPKRDGFRYFTVDLSDQRACMKIDGEAIFCDSVSTGLTGPTPIGHFKIFARYTNGCMSGPDYHLCNIHWIQYFTGAGHSFHEKWWNNIYGAPSSHGCVNMRYASAKRFYEFGRIGMDVYIQQ